MSVKRHRKNTF